MKRPTSYQHVPEFPFTAGLMILACLVTVLWRTGTDVSVFTMDGRAFGAEPWRLLTSALPHADLLHLMFNLYWLWVFGSVLEMTLGHFPTAGIVCLLAAGSGAAEYALFEGGVGLSGVGYGLFAFLWVVGRKDRRFAGCVDRQTATLFVLWFFLCIALTAAGKWNVANVAHGAGAGLGALMGLAYTSKEKWWSVHSGALALSLLVVVAMSTFARPYVNLSGDVAQELARSAGRAFDDGDYARSAGCLERAVALDEGHAYIWYNLGLSYARMGRAADAVRALERAHSLDPLDTDTRELLADQKTLLAVSRGDAGDHAGAAAVLREAVEVNPRDDSAWYFLGLAKRELGLHAEAVRALEKAVELNPQEKDYADELRELRGEGTATDEHR